MLKWGPVNLYGWCAGTRQVAAHWNQLTDSNQNRRMEKPEELPRVV